MKKFARFFIILSVFFYAFGLYQLWLRANPNRLAFTDYRAVQTVQKEKESEPVHLTVNNKQIDVPIIPARVTNNVWETTDAGASYLQSSPIPGQKGNSVIYAHNWSNLFGNLPHVKPGDTVTIKYADGKKKTFVIQYTSLVGENEATILAPSKDKRITLYTCSGWFDEKRFVAVAVLKG
jgi:LPXTG-site transpeptidase (sortase) family protein